MNHHQGKFGGILAGKDKSLDLPARFEPRLIAFLLLTVGVAEIVGGVSFGRLGDRFGMSVVMVAGCALPCVLGIVLVYINFLTGECVCRGQDMGVGAWGGGGSGLKVNVVWDGCNCLSSVCVLLLVGWL
jgi:MFS family permease